MPIMIKSEFREILSDKHSQLSLSDVESAVKIMLEYIAQTLASGERVEIRGGAVVLIYIIPHPIMVEILRQVKQFPYHKNIRLILRQVKNLEKGLIIQLIVFSNEYLF